jgi:hypothetical protein
LEEPALLSRSKKIRFHLRVGFSGDRSPGDEHELDWLLKIVLMAAKDLAHQATCARTRDGIADFSRGDDAEPEIPLPCVRIRAPPIEYQATFDDPLSFEAHAPEFPASLQPLCLREPERLTAWSLARHVQSRIIPASIACDRRGGDWPELRDRSCWNCGSRSRAAVSGAFWTVDIGVS